MLEPHGKLYGEALKIVIGILHYAADTMEDLVPSQSVRS